MKEKLPVFFKNLLTAIQKAQLIDFRSVDQFSAFDLKSLITFDILQEAIVRAHKNGSSQAGSRRHHH